MQQNILMIMTDQMHKYALGAVTPYLHTPNLDRLAREGTLFLNGYSNNPICGPFRGLLYSGRYSKDCGVQENGMNLRPEEVTLPQEMKQAGYETSFVGKLHLGGNGNGPVPRECWAGHDHFIGYQCYNGFLDNVCFYDENGTEHRYEDHRTDVTGKLGVQRLRMLAETGKPFLHTVFFQAPHYPEQPGKQYEHLYDSFEFPLPEQYAPVDPYTPTYSPQSPTPFEKCPDYRRYGRNIQKYLGLYYAMVSQIDANVGLLLKELEQLSIADRTTVIFSSDHGDMQGSHGKKNKCLPFERSCGVPFIVKVPGQEHRAVTAPVSSVDIYPTCMELAGVKSRKDLPGHSLLPLIRGETTKHAPVFAEDHTRSDRWYMLRDARYKLVIESLHNKPVMLFDMIDDPEESRNLINLPLYEEIQSRMYAMLMREVGDYHYVGKTGEV